MNSFESYEQYLAWLHAEAYDWLLDCFEDCPQDLRNGEIRNAIERHYEGGWSAFVTACGSFEVMA